LQVSLLKKRPILKDPQKFLRNPFAVVNLLKTISEQYQLKQKVNSSGESKWTTTTRTKVHSSGESVTSCNANVRSTPYLYDRSATSKLQ